MGEGLQRAAVATLPPRMREVLVLLADGHTNGEIAAMLSISTKTVETHRARLYDRLGCDSRAGLVAAARLAPSNVGRAPEDAAARSPQGISIPTTS